MPLKNLVRVPCDIPPEVNEQLNKAIETTGMKRTELIRIFVRHGLDNLKEVLLADGSLPVNVANRLTKGKKK